MRYLPKSDSERRQMLDVIGADSVESLFAHLPPSVRLNRPLELPAGISEYEIAQYFRDLAAQNADGYSCFLGAGVYRHFRPVAEKGEEAPLHTDYLRTAIPALVPSATSALSGLTLILFAFLCVSAPLR